MRKETCYDKTDGVAELRGRLDKIREGFENATEPPETEFAAIQDAIMTGGAADKARLDWIETGVDYLMLRKPYRNRNGEWTAVCESYRSTIDHAIAKANAVDHARYPKR